MCEWGLSPSSQAPLQAFSHVMYKKKTESMLCNQKLGEAREHGHFLHKSMGDMKVFLFTFDISLINSVELQGNIA